MITFGQKKIGRAAVVFFILLGILLRIISANVLQPHVDEMKLLDEIRNLHWYPLPVHFYGFGWGEHVPLALIAWPFITWLRLPGVAVLRCIVFIANYISLGLLFLLARRWFGPIIAAVTICIASIWPWNIITGTIGFNAFLTPQLFLGAMLSFEKYRAQQKNSLLVIAALLFSAMCYLYAASFLWIPTIIFLYWLAYPKVFTLKKILMMALMCLVLAWPIALVHIQSQFNLQLPTQIGPLGFPHLDQSRFSNASLGFFYHTPATLIGHYVLNYISHFAFIFLVFSPAYSLIGRGVMPGLYLNPMSFILSLFHNHVSTDTPLFDSTLAFVWDVFLIPLGIYALIRSKQSKELKRFFIAWLVLYPAGPSLVNADFVGYTITRDLFGLPLLMMFAAYGLVFGIKKLLEH